MNIFVTVKPKARQDRVEIIDDTHFVVHTKKIPEKGKANDSVIEQIAKYFSLSKSHISILSGKSSRLKVISISK